MQNLQKKPNTTTKADLTNGSPHNKRRCQFCGQVAELVWVHGHGQCSACGINAEECCRGETCNN